jgi:hypothetical protein
MGGDWRLERARQLMGVIESAQSRTEAYREIADHIADWIDEDPWSRSNTSGRTHAMAGEAVKKSRQWVTVLLEWRAGGYSTGGPNFNPARPARKSEPTAGSEFPDPEASPRVCPTCKRPW